MAPVAPVGLWTTWCPFARNVGLTVVERELQALALGAPRRRRIKSRRRPALMDKRRRPVTATVGSMKTERLIPNTGPRSATLTGSLSRTGPSTSKGPSCSGLWPEQVRVMAVVASRCLIRGRPFAIARRWRFGRQTERQRKRVSLKRPPWPTRGIAMGPFWPLVGRSQWSRRSVLAPNMRSPMKETPSAPTGGPWPVKENGASCRALPSPRVRRRLPWPSTVQLPREKRRL